MSRPSASSPDDAAGNQDVIIAAVERSMKKHSENLMRFLEGLSSRLSQLELYCYNVDKSVGEMRSDLARHHGDSDTNLKFLDKHLQEVHRCVQIIRDKQELADTQKELAKLQLTQKESSSGHGSQKSEEKETSTPSSDTKRNDETNNNQQQLALALPAAPHPQTYYLSPGQLPPPGQVSQNHYQTQPPPRAQVAQPQPHLQYQQQWAQQVSQPPQPAVRPASPQVFPSYLPTQQANPEPLPNNLPMQMPYGFGGPSRSNQQQLQAQQPPQHMKPAFGGQPGDGYAGGSHGNTYVMYESGSQAVYPPNPQQHSGGSNSSSMMGRPPPQFMRNHPYNEVIDKLGSMGYRGEHVMNVIQRLEETGQTVDFNTVLDRLNVHPSGGPQRGGGGGGGWSG